MFGKKKVKFALFSSGGNASGGAMGRGFFSRIFRKSESEGEDYESRHSS